MKIHLQKLFLAVTILTVSLSASLFAQDQYQNQGQDQDQGGGDPPDRVARLGYISGSVSFQPNGEDQWSQALPNYPMTTGDRLYTDRDGRAELETGNIAVRLSSGTDVTTTNLSDRLVQIGLAQGTLRVRAFDVRDGNSVEVDTPNAALVLLRPGSYRVETYPDDNSTLVVVNSGDLEIDGNGFSQVIHSGQSVKLTGADQVQMSWVQPPRNDDFDQWCGDRDRRFLSSNSRQYVGSYVPGYDDLDQYGQWQSTPDYGAVWYPTAVPADWAPYRYGRWAWVEPWGWTWVEDEPWGFAPFHYGRWALVGSRWGWVPGTVTVAAPVYAPALVAFVGGGDANVQVWFPLGPRDPYFPWYHHSDGYLRQVNVTNVRTQVNIINVINVRNVENVHYTYQRVAPTAVSVDTFRSSRPVAHATVRIDNTAMARARVIPHPEIRPDVHAISAGTAATHPPVERIRPKVESRPPLVNKGQYQIDQRGNQPGQANNNRPQGNPPPNQQGQFNRYPAQNGNNQPAANGQNNNRPADSRNTPGYSGRPAEADRTAPSGSNQPAANSQNNNRPPDARTGPGYSGRPAEVQRENPPSGQNPNKPPAQQNAQNPVPAQNPNANNERNNPGRENFGRENGNNGPGNNAANNNNADTRGRAPGGPPQNAGNPQNGPAQNQRPLVTKNPPPQQNPSFAQRQPAMQEHPGRPLEPQQMDNLRRGQPAGQMRDRETPEHHEAAPPQRPQPQQQSKPANPPPQNNDRGKDNKDKEKDKPK
jgi:hypothetical protein